jgi:hypothetical protein
MCGVQYKTKQKTTRAEVQTLSTDLMFIDIKAYFVKQIVKKGKTNLT